MKKIIIGKRAVGKTHYIVNSILPKEKDYLIFDLCNEYKHLKIDESKIINLKDGYEDRSEIKNKVISKVKESSNETILVFDSLELLCYPNAKEQDSGFNWLFEILEDKSYIMTFQSLTYLKDLSIFPLSSDEEIYMFPTTDSDDVFIRFLDILEKHEKIYHPMIYNQMRIEMEKDGYF